MEFRTFTAGKDDDGRRLDRVLKKITADGAKINQALRKSLVLLNGKKADAAEKVRAGDEIRAAAFLLRNFNDVSHKKAENKNLSDIILRHTILKTPDFLIINKPYDISVQGGSQNLCNAVAELFRGEQKTESISFNPGPLHRLDRKTTGVLVFSQSLAGAKWFSETLSLHRIKKTYIAIIKGKLNENARWEDFISDDGERKNDSKSFHKVSAKKTDTDGAKKAVTNAFPLAFGEYDGETVTLAEFKIETGRKHQIRAQSALHGHPLLGDTAYGAKKISESQDFFLHALRMEIPAENPFALPEKIDAFILTNFRKMLDKLLIKWHDTRII